MTRIAERPPAVPAAAAVMARAGGENFPVASRALPRGVRDDLLAVYGFARLTDELGDSFASTPAERLAALDWLEHELDAAYAGRAEHPLLVRLQPTIATHLLPREPFLRLIEANRVDQRVSRYATWQELRGYCKLSADPVGELVLRIFGLATSARIALSDCVCTALQLIEHCQDVAEDYTHGRVYLPREDLERFNCPESQLASAHAGPELRDVLAFEARRAHALLDEGAPLIGTLRGRPRLAVAAFVAGGRAALAAIERNGYDVLPGPPKPGRVRTLYLLAHYLLRGGR